MDNIGENKQMHKQTHMYHNSLIESDENPELYISEYTSVLIDNSNPVVPLTTEINLISHVNNN